MPYILARLWRYPACKVQRWQGYLIACVQIICLA